jgi:hypothetical protein
MAAWVVRSLEPLRKRRHTDPVGRCRNLPPCARVRFLVAARQPRAKRSAADRVFGSALRLVCWGRVNALGMLLCTDGRHGAGAHGAAWDRSGGVAAKAAAAIVTFPARGRLDWARVKTEPCRSKLQCGAGSSVHDQRRVAAKKPGSRALQWCGGSEYSGSKRRARLEPVLPRVDDFEA